jgi:hypothetical protein
MAAGLAPGEAAGEAVKELIELRGRVEGVLPRLKERLKEIDATLARLNSSSPPAGDNRPTPTSRRSRSRQK